MTTTSNPAEPPSLPLPCTVVDGFTFAAVGDLIGPLRPETTLNRPGFNEVMRLLQQADIGFGNQEGSIFDIDAIGGTRAAENGGGYPLSNLEVARDLKAMGLDVVSKANNHATDWGAEGLLATCRALVDAGVVPAGAGPSKPAARAPVFIETPKGRVAVISTATTYTPMSEAGNADGDTLPRPGISVLGLKAITLLPECDMVGVRRAAKLQGMDTALDSRARGDERELTIGSETFRVADEPGLTYEMNSLDHRELLRAVRGAKQGADLVAFTVHAHETASGDGVDRSPADFLPKLMHSVIDSGADIALTTGPHLVRGIEIYRGKPIFYGLGSFFLELEGSRGVSTERARQLGIDPLDYTGAEFVRKRLGVLSDAWYDSVVAVCEFRAGGTCEVRLHPLRLERKDGFRWQGAPRLAMGGDARRILEQLQHDSRPFGTEIEIAGDVGVIRIQSPFATLGV